MLKILNLAILGFFREMNIFGGMTILWLFSLNYIKRSFLCILGSFLKVKVQNGGFFWGC